MSIFLEFNSADLKGITMTNVFNTYSFMDLLKDNNYVPEAAAPIVEFPTNVASVVEYFTDMLKNTSEDYDFMDLLSDNGYVPVNDNWVKPYTITSDDIEQIAS